MDSPASVRRIQSTASDAESTTHIPLTLFKWSFSKVRVRAIRLIHSCERRCKSSPGNGPLTRKMEHRQGSDRELLIWINRQTVDCFWTPKFIWLGSGLGVETLPWHSTGSLVCAYLYLGPSLFESTQWFVLIHSPFSFRNRLLSTSVSVVVAGL
jgi:hypothetical protein